jgi:DNA-binding MarR family transcriptional regulator
MLSKGELEVLAGMEDPLTISELAMEIGYSKSYVSRQVTSLIDKELVVVVEDGRRKVVEPSKVEPVRVYRDLVQQYPHVDFPELLAGKAISILYYLDDSITVGELADRTGNYRNTVNRIINRFQNRGMLAKDGSKYYLNESFQLLGRFARALVTHLHIVDSPVGSGTILWESPSEYLLQTTAEIDDDRYHLTGPRKFSEYELPLMTTDRRHYFYTERQETLTPEDVACHMLLIDDGARQQGYCLLLLARTDVDLLRDRATHYEIEDTIEDLLTYLDTDGKQAPEGLPRWSDFERMAADYGVNV